MINILLNERCARILYKLVQVNRPCKVLELSKEFGVSIRTIRYDLEKIDDFLKQEGFNVLKKTPNKGVEFCGSKDDKERLLANISNINDSNYILTPRERQNIILIELLQASDYITVEYLSNLLLVSRNTIKNDLKSVRLWLKKNGLKLMTVPRYGIKVEGEEQDLRRAAILLLTETLDIKTSIDKIKFPLRSELINKLFGHVDVEFIEKTVKKAEDELQRVFSDEAFTGLVIHIAFAIKRIQLGKDIVMPQQELAKLKMTKEFGIASNIAKNLENHFCIKIPEDEIGYITLHLLGGKVAAPDPAIKGNWFRTHILVNKIIEAVQRELGVDFSADDELYRGLIEHFGPTLFRLENRLSVKNPILNEIKTNYSTVFYAVKNGINTLEEIRNLGISEEEIGYITLHFGAALERMKMVNEREQKILVVCGTGIGTANLLSSRLKAEFDNINIIDIVASHQVEKILSEKQVDLIVSTVFLNISTVPVVIVNPLLPEEDVIKVGLKLRRNKSKLETIENQKSFPLILKTLKGVIERPNTLKSQFRLLKDLGKLVDLFNGFILKGVVRPMLKDLLTDKTIKTNVEAKSWEDAVRIGGELLVQNDCVEPRYVEAMVRNVKEIGPYVVIAPGVAMPHARPEEGVKQVCMSLITLKDPVPFGNKLNDPVKMVICFGTIDNSTHLKALSQLANLFMDCESMDNLLNAKSVDRILEIIDKFSNDDD